MKSKVLLAAGLASCLALDSYATTRHVITEPLVDEQRMDQEIEQYIFPDDFEQESRNPRRRNNRQKGRHFEDERIPKTPLEREGYPC